MLERIPKIIWRPVLTHLCSVKEKEKQITGAEIFVIPRDIKVSFIYKMWAVRSSIWVDLHIFFICSVKDADFKEIWNITIDHVCNKWNV